MELTSDVLLKGRDWSETIDLLSDIIPSPLHYNVYILCVAIGIVYDKQIEINTTENDDSKSVPRNVIQNNNRTGVLDYLFQAAIITSKTISLTEDERLDLAFNSSSKIEFKRMDFLTLFANYGVKKLKEQIDKDEMVTMDNLKCFLSNTFDGLNIDFKEIEKCLLED